MSNVLIQYVRTFNIISGKSLQKVINVHTQILVNRLPNPHATLTDFWGEHTLQVIPNYNGFKIFKLDRNYRF